MRRSVGGAAAISVGVRFAAFSRPFSPALGRRWCSTWTTTWADPADRGPSITYRKVASA